MYRKPVNYVPEYSILKHINIYVQTKGTKALKCILDELGLIITYKNRIVFLYFFVIMSEDANRTRNKLLYTISCEGDEAVTELGTLVFSSLV